MSKYWPKITCDDCKKQFDHRLIDAWLSPLKNPDSAGEADAHLCEACFAKRGPSAWGPWVKLA